LGTAALATRNVSVYTRFPCRGVGTRYDKRDYMYQTAIDVASVRIWLRDPVS
jgi:hypothetical protein